MSLVNNISDSKNLRVTQHRGVVRAVIDRSEHNNTINEGLISELTDLIYSSELIPDIKVIIISGDSNNFCTGMDFKEVSKDGASALGSDPGGYYELLKKMSLSPKIIITKVEGKVNAGGVGVVAASDIVIATGNATFSLSEALFGLLPACVMPFLIRRVGFQRAQNMALTTATLSADRAYQIGLVDDLTNDIDNSIRRSLLRLTRLDSRTVKDLKNYMDKLWIISNDTQNMAVDKLKSLMSTETVLENISNYVQKGKFPWDKS